MNAETIIAIILAANSIISTIGGAVVAIAVAKISNSDKAKKEISDFILSFWSKEDIEKLVKSGEINSYDKPSQKKIQEYYITLKAKEEKENNNITVDLDEGITD